MQHIQYPNHLDGFTQMTSVFTVSHAIIKIRIEINSLKYHRHQWPVSQVNLQYNLQVHIFSWSQPSKKELHERGGQ